MASGFAGGRIAVMATGAVGGTGKGAVIGLGTRPRAGGFVAAFTIGRGLDVASTLAGGRAAVVAV